LSDRHVFSFEGQALICVFLGGVLVLGGLLGGIVFSQEGLSGMLVVAGMALPFLIVGPIALVGKSQLLIDDEKISRRLFGVVIQTLRWDNVRLVRSFPQGVGGTMRRGVNILAKKAVKGNLYPISRIVFIENPENAELISVLNHYVNLYGIEVENSFGSTKNDYL
jgi:hypothetical protein